MKQPTVHCGSPNDIGKQIQPAQQKKRNYEWMRPPEEILIGNPRATPQPNFF